MNINIKTENHKVQESFSIVLLIVLFGVGILFHQWETGRMYVMKITDIFLFLTNSLIYIFLLRKAKSKGISGKFIIWSIVAFLLTFSLEYMGVKTGHIFGSYHYGETMMIQAGDVPLVIAFNWIILILAVNALGQKIISQKYLVPVLASVFIVIFDYIMEPVAVMLDYWQWEGGAIPVLNYVAWFTISLVLSYLMMFMGIKPFNSVILRAYFFIQLLFFLSFWIFPV